MRRLIPPRGKYQPFHSLRKVGFSVTQINRFERLRRMHENHGRSLCVLSWPDGIWCVLIMHTENFGIVVLGEAQKTDAYHDARQMIRDGYSPVLTLRHERHA
jgi:hypothetical protein